MMKNNLSPKNSTWQDELDQVLNQLMGKQSNAPDPLDCQTKKILATLVAGRAIINRAFYDDTEINLLLKATSQLIDAVLCKLWQHHSHTISQSVAIIAVGGYGRAEMHPSSDVDLLILLEEEPDESCQSAISGFITQLWDLKLDIGHSVRTLAETSEVAESDLTVITNLIESNFLTGDKTLFHQLTDMVSDQQLWSSPKFFQAKIGEQQERYKRYGDTAYRVEPNLKEGPGGLRDIHMISWVTMREYNTLSLDELHHLKLITKREYETLIVSRNFLWRVRFAMHLLAKRKEDRLLLEHQQSLAELFGYDGEEGTNQSVEQFMQHYYQVITQMARMNELLLGIFRENILSKDMEEQTTRLNDWCSRQGSYLTITDPDIFQQQPHTLLEIFYLLQLQSGIRGLTPQTIRMIHSHLYIIDDHYRAQPTHQKIFMNIMSESHGITHVLRRMNRYGILAAWIPAFANIVGRMQFDLFHAYTVDDHTLRVISMVRKNSVPKGAEEMPYESLIFKSLADPKILYLAALFHDIAKGRGGNHSKLGAVDAYEFCRLHQLDFYDSHLVSWLVSNHLVLSITAQQKDTSDPDVIQEFAHKMVSSSRLDYLYLLTIADMKATNPNLWNGWKHQLLQSLYKNTRKVLKHSLPPSSYEELVQQRLKSVLEQLPIESIDKESGKSYCQRMGNDYILNHSVDTILWQMTYIQKENVYPLIQIRPDKKHDTISLFIYSHGSDELFAQTTEVLGRLNINILAAYIMHTPNGFSLETLHIFGPENQPLTESDNQNYLINALRTKITDDHSKSNHHFPIPRLLKAFTVKTRISIHQDTEKKQTKITIRSIDFPGLLAKLSRIFYTFKYRVVGARITTLGEEVEDIFYLTDLNDQPITGSEQLALLHEALLKEIDNID